MGWECFFVKYLEAESDHMIQSGDFPTSLTTAARKYLKRTTATLARHYGDLLLQRTAREPVRL